MSPSKHYEEAERLLASLPDPLLDFSERDQIIRQAQVHATLAGASSYAYIGPDHAQTRTNHFENGEKR